MKYTLGFSPCPNDTFIFDALVNGKIDTKGFEFDCVMEDVETLNRWAFDGRLDITKLSFSTILQTTDQYRLLDSGAALGFGVGPLLITKEKHAFEHPAALRSFLTRARIAIPGKNTTANLLLTLAFPEATQKNEVLFSEIENNVLAGKYDCGLVIHESRFTYAARGLHKLMDMGEWWEQESGTAIPLGGICIQKNIPTDTVQAVELLIKESIAYSWNHYPELSPFVTNNAQEMEESVMRQHINLYVNDYTSSLEGAGKKAISILFEKAKAARLIDVIPDDLFVS